MESDRPKYQGGKIGDRDAFRLHEPAMDDEEYQSYRMAWLREFPCRCEGACRCQGPPARKPRHVRILVVLPEEPPQLTPRAARALLRILMEAADKPKREADGR
jgi:hypothetical protein